MTAFADDRNIVITGFMGTGKSTIGKLLAARLDIDFVDTDRVIEQRHGPITAIFDTRGEEGFREIERGLAQELGGRSGLVISTGGGLMLDADSEAALSSGGRVFCLSASPATILERLISDRSLVERPLLSVPNPQRRIVEMLAERTPGYMRFEQVDTDGRSATDIVDTIVDLLTGDHAETG